jgi:hypothetical protein
MTENKWDCKIPANGCSTFGALATEALEEEEEDTCQRILKATNIQ